MCLSEESCSPVEGWELNALSLCGAYTLPLCFASRWLGFSAAHACTCVAESYFHFFSHFHLSDACCPDIVYVFWPLAHLSPCDTWAETSSMCLPLFYCTDWGLFLLFPPPLYLSFASSLFYKGCCWDRYLSTKEAHQLLDWPGINHTHPAQGCFWSPSPWAGCFYSAVWIPGTRTDARQPLDDRGDWFQILLSRSPRGRYGSDSLARSTPDAAITGLRHQSLLARCVVLCEAFMMLGAMFSYTEFMPVLMLSQS